MAGLDRRAQLRGERPDRAVHALDRAVLGDEPRRGLLAHPRHPGDVVGGVALQRLVVDHLVRPEAESGHDLGLVVNHGVLESLTGGHELGPRRDELQRIEVTGQDEGLQIDGLGLLGERADDVVGLEAGERVHRDPELFEELLAALELRPEVVGHRLPGGLVGRVALVPEGRDRKVEAGRNVDRRDLLDDLEEDRGEAEDRVHQLPLRRRERGDGEEAPVDEAVGVDQEEALAHEPSIAGQRRCSLRWNASASAAQRAARSAKVQGGGPNSRAVAVRDADSGPPWRAACGGWLAAGPAAREAVPVAVSTRGASACAWDCAGAASCPRAAARSAAVVPPPRSLPV